ncbi:hypothetical protein C8R42DRAFT_398200 [Lentinula raphanica]|nr:hypothetical protein C8R42DRAFT_398200 [Lentinula raphanica]
MLSVFLFWGLSSRLSFDLCSCVYVVKCFSLPDGPYHPCSLRSVDSDVEDDPGLVRISGYLSGGRENNKEVTSGLMTGYVGCFPLGNSNHGYCWKQGPFDHHHRNDVAHQLVGRSVFRKLLCPKGNNSFSLLAWRAAESPSARHC